MQDTVTKLTFFVLLGILVNISCKKDRIIFHLEKQKKTVSITLKESETSKWKISDNAVESQIMLIDDSLHYSIGICLKTIDIKPNFDTLNKIDYKNIKINKPVIIAGNYFFDQYGTRYGQIAWHVSQSIIDSTYVEIITSYNIDSKENYKFHYEVLYSFELKNN